MPIRPEDKIDIAERLAVASSIATLNSESKNTQNAISSLAGEVRAGNAQSNQQNTAILESIAVLRNQQEGNAKYQDECDRERKDMRDDIVAIKTKCGLIAAACGSIGTAAMEALGAWLHK